MCGLVGVAGEISKKDVDVFNQLLVIDQIRGPHSTGVASVSRGLHRDIEVFKRVGDPSALMEYRRYDSIVSQSKQVLIGHNRFATVGRQISANAHPFAFDNVVGAHNGTLPHHVNAKLLGHNMFDTDSEALFNNIEQEGIENTIKKLTAGAYALTWYDKRAHRMNFLRNSERALFIARSESGKSIYWASEALMLHFILSRNGVKYDDPEILPVDTLLSFDLPEVGKTFELPFLREVKPEPTPVYEYKSYQQGGSAFGSQRDGHWVNNNFIPWDDYLGEEETTVTVTKKEADTTENVVVPFLPKASVTVTPLLEGPKREATESPAQNGKAAAAFGTARLKNYKGPNGEEIDRATFNEWTIRGCAYCEGNGLWGDDILFLKSDGIRSFLCETCCKDEETIELIWQGADKA